MRTHGLAAPTQADIRLDLVSMNEWRVRDRRLPDSDPKSVLGVIVRRDARYLVSCPDGVQREHGSLATATASFADG